MGLGEAHAQPSPWRPSWRGRSALAVGWGSLLLRSYFLPLSPAVLPSSPPDLQPPAHHHSQLSQLSAAFYLQEHTAYAQVLCPCLATSPSASGFRETSLPPGIPPGSDHSACSCRPLSRLCPDAKPCGLRPGLHWSCSCPPSLGMRLHRNSDPNCPRKASTRNHWARTVQG